VLLLNLAVLVSQCWLALLPFISEKETATAAATAAAAAAKAAATAAAATSAAATAAAIEVKKVCHVKKAQVVDKTQLHAKKVPIYLEMSAGWSSAFLFPPLPPPAFFLPSFLTEVCPLAAGVPPAAELEAELEAAASWEAGD